MKKIILGLLLLGCFKGNAQQDKILFDYDNAGNQTVRRLCYGCSPTEGKVNPTPKELTEIKEQDLQKFFPEDVISYYPNPVKEQLYLKWELINDIKVSEIQIYSLSGQLMKSFNKLEGQNNYVITFSEYPQGMYELVLIYTNGDDKSIKIIKQ